MTDHQMDGDLDNGTVTNANGDASGNQGVQQPSFDAAKLQETLDALNSNIKTLQARVNGLQSVKDKDKKELSDLKGKIAEYEQLKERLGPEGAMEQIELRDQLAQMNEQLSKLTGSVSTQSHGTGASEAVNAAKAFAQAGFTDEELKDPRVSVALQGKYQSNELAELAAYRLKQQLANSPNPTAAQGAAIQGKPAQIGDFDGKTDEQLGEELTRLATDNFRGSAEQRRAINEELDRRAKNRS